MADTSRTQSDLLTSLFPDGQAANSITAQDMRDLIVSLSMRGGYADYNDLATATTPLSHTGGVDTYLTNDAAGANTAKNWINPGITDVWDDVADEFDWSELAVGDTVDIRFDIDVTTTAANQEIDIDLEMASGDAIQFDLHFLRDSFKTAGTYKIGAVAMIYIGSATVQTTPAKFKLSSASNASIQVNGWFCRVVKV